jgi:hypothetical protein
MIIDFFIIKLRKIPKILASRESDIIYDIVFVNKRYIQVAI